MTIPFNLAATLAARSRLERELGAGGRVTVYLAQDNDIPSFTVVQVTGRRGPGRLTPFFQRTA